MFQNGGRQIRFRHVIEPPTKAPHTIIQTLIIGWITPSTCLVCLGIVFSEIGGYFLQDILTHLVPSCVNVRCWWDRNWTQIFPFVKTAQCLISLRFRLRYLCFFHEEISKMTFFSFSWSRENTSQRHYMVVNWKEQLHDTVWEWCFHGLEKTWSRENTSQRHYMVVNWKEQLHDTLWEWITAICRQDVVRADANCDLANQSVSRDKFAFSLGVPFEL